jgi:hypothetical protein
MDKQGRRLMERLPISSTFSLGTLLWPDKPAKPTASLLCAADPYGAGGKVAQNETEGIRIARLREEYLGPLPESSERTVATIRKVSIRPVRCQY